MKTLKKQEEKKENKIGHQIYLHLMNGINHMLPFVVGGGILMALAFMLDSIGVDVASLQDKSTFGTITPQAALLMKIGKTSFGFMLPVLAGFIAMSIADRPGLALGFVGGAIALNGKSGFIGALIAGFLGGYLIVLLKKVFSRFPEKLDGLKPVLLYPLIGIFLMGISVIYVVEPVFGAMNMGINTALESLSGASSIFLGLIVGGMMSVDLGGPFNKAAYLFAITSMASGNYSVMAAVMLGGMVPPMACALATFLFRHKFTLEERKAGPSSFIMGLSFISEGAIPYAAADPIHVIPALIVGSATAGALSMAFHCTLMAPHGGIFVFLLAENASRYLLALIVGTVVGALLIGILKKAVKE